MATYVDEKRRRIEQFAHCLRLMGMRRRKVVKGDDCFIVFDEQAPEDADSARVSENCCARQYYYAPGWEEDSAMDTPALELDQHSPPVGPEGCKCGGFGYARILLQHYLNRVGVPMAVGGSRVAAVRVFLIVRVERQADLVGCHVFPLRGTLDALCGSGDSGCGLTASSIRRDCPGPPSPASSVRPERLPSQSPASTRRISGMRSSSRT